MTNLLWVAILIFPLLGFWGYGLFDLDEGFYAAVTAEMIKNNQYIIPTYQGLPWFEKPILLYWTTICSIRFLTLCPTLLPSVFIVTPLLYFLKDQIKRKILNTKFLIYTIAVTLFLFFLFNQSYFLSPPLSLINPCSFFRLSEFALRLPSFLSIVALYASIYYWTKRWVNIDTALAATLICSTSILTVAIGKLMLTDALYTCLFTNALLSYYHAITHNPKNKIWTGIFLGFAMLAKGPVAPFLFGVIILITHFLMPHLNKRSYWLPSLLAFFMIISLWYVPVYLQMPKTFWNEFIINQNIQRFLGGDKAHKINNIFLSFLYYVPILFIALLPWSLKLKKALQNSSPLATYLKIWTTTIFIFFTLSQSKLPHYIFPCVPPLAILLGFQVGIPQLQSKKFLFIRTLHTIFIFGMIHTIFSLWYTRFHPEEMIARQATLDLDQVYISSEMKHFPLHHYYWYDSLPLKKGPLGLSLTSHPSATFYKLFGHNPLQHKYLQDKPILEIKDFNNLKIPCALITRGNPNPLLLTYLNTKNVRSYSYCYPQTQTPYITIYILNNKKDCYPITYPSLSNLINTYMP